MNELSKLKWKELFAARILNRGYDYYLDGKVWDLHYEIGKATATVAGTEDYRVTITMTDDEITDMDCDCPYASDGNYCKHEAAVLYALSEEPEDTGSENCEHQGLDEEQTNTCHSLEDEQGRTKLSWIRKLETEREELKKHIACMSEDEMREMLSPSENHKEEYTIGKQYTAKDI